MKVKKKKIISIGSLSVELPIIKIGRGSPVMSVVCGVHGDETTGLFVVKELLKKINKVKGTLQVFPSANPLAQALLMRRTLVDQVDMNRVFPGKKGSVGEQTAKTLLGLLKNNDLVVDLHTSKLETPLMGVLFNNDKESKKLLEYFGPRQVWVINNDENYEGTLGNQLFKMGIPNFGVELNKQECFSKKDINDCVNGLLNVMKKMKMLSGKPVLKKTVFYTKSEYRTNKTGLFTPLKKPFDKLRKGGLVGTLTILPGFEQEKILAHQSGTILQVSRERMVLPGKVLFSIGEKLEQ